MRVRYLTTEALKSELRLVVGRVTTASYPIELEQIADDLLEALESGESPAQVIADTWVKERGRFNRCHLIFGSFPPIPVPMRKPRPVIMEQYVTGRRRS